MASNLIIDVNASNQLKFIHYLLECEFEMLSDSYSEIFDYYNDLFNVNAVNLTLTSYEYKEYDLINTYYCCFRKYNHYYKFGNVCEKLIKILRDESIGSHRARIHICDCYCKKCGDDIYGYYSNIIKIVYDGFIKNKLIPEFKEDFGQNDSDHYLKMFIKYCTEQSQKFIIEDIVDEYINENHINEQHKQFILNVANKVGIAAFKIRDCRYYDKLSIYFDTALSFIDDYVDDKYLHVDYNIVFSQLKATHSNGYNNGNEYLNKLDSIVKSKNVKRLDIKNASDSIKLDKDQLFIAGIFKEHELSRLKFSEFKPTLVTQSDIKTFNEQLLDQVKIYQYVQYNWTVKICLHKNHLYVNVSNTKNSIVNSDIDKYYNLKYNIPAQLKFDGDVNLIEVSYWRFLNGRAYHTYYEDFESYGDYVRNDNFNSVRDDFEKNYSYMIKN